MNANLMTKKIEMSKGHCHVQMIPQTVEVTIVGQNRFVTHALCHLRIHKARKDFLNFPTFLSHLHSLFSHKSDPLPFSKIEV